MKPLGSFEGKVAFLLQENIDTDQIFPARFMKTTQRKGLGNTLFADWRYQSEGKNNPDFPLNSPEQKDASILVAGYNFGCGSSREHAVWALIDYGFKAIISTGFSDIFTSNALKNGLLIIQIDQDVYRSIAALSKNQTEKNIFIDVDKQKISLPDGQEYSFPLDGFVKHCLLNGIDHLDYLFQMDKQISSFEKQYRQPINTKVISKIMDEEKSE